MSIKSRVQAFMANERKQPVVEKELGATGTSVFAGLLYEEDYNSDLQGEKALKVYDKMRRSDGQVKAGLLACKLPLMVARWDMTPASQEEQDVEIAGMVKEDLFENMTITWDDFLRQALIMLDFGHMAFEKVWELRDGRYTWRKLAPRLPQSIAEWHVKDDGDLDFIIQQANIGTQFKRIPIPADKLLVFSHEKEGSNFRGISLLRAAYKHWWYKNNLYAIDGIAAERHGVGLADFTYPDQATDAQKAAVKEVGERLHAHERAYTAHPESVKFDLKGVQGQLHDIMRSIDHHDLQIVRSILAQFMNLGAKSTGSYALSQDQSQFFLMALQAVGKNVCNTVNRNCIREMVDYNWDVKRYPHLTVSGLDSPDVMGYAQAIAQLVTAGAITNDLPTENELRRMVKLPQKAANAPAAPLQPVKHPTEDKPREWPAEASETGSRLGYRPDQARTEEGKFEEEGAPDSPPPKDGRGDAVPESSGKEAAVQSRIKSEGDQFAKENAQGTIEKCVVWGNDGNMVLKQDGDSTGIILTKDQIAQVRGAKEMIHNHAFGGPSLSTADGDFAHEAEIQHMSVSNGEEVFTLEAGQWTKGIDAYDIRQAYEGEYSKILDRRLSREVFEKAKAEGKAVDAKSLLKGASSDAWQNVADKNLLGTGFKYSRRSL